MMIISWEEEVWSLWCFITLSSSLPFFAFTNSAVAYIVQKWLPPLWDSNSLCLPRVERWTVPCRKVVNISFIWLHFYLVDALLLLVTSIAKVLFQAEPSERLWMEIVCEWIFISEVQKIHLHRIVRPGWPTKLCISVTSTVSIPGLISLVPSPLILRWTPFDL